MKKLLIAILSVIFSCALCVSTVAIAENDQPIAINTADELLSISGKDGNYVLESDIVLPSDSYVKEFYGSLDGNNHTVTVDNDYGLFRYFGFQTPYNDERNTEKIDPATAKNLTVKGTVKGSGAVGGFSAYAIGLLENVRVETNVSSTSIRAISGIANCIALNGEKQPLSMADCTFAGSVTMLQGFTSQSNYTYFGMFMGYNGGAFGTGYFAEDRTILLKNCVAEYTFAIPTSEIEKVQNIEYFNVNENRGENSSYTTKVEGDNTIYTFKNVVNMNRVDVSSVNDEGIMANYGTPSIRFTVEDASEKNGYSYRYLDGFNRAECRMETAFSASSFDDMYKYIDISDLKVTGVSSVDAPDNDFDTSITSKYATVEIHTPEQFESFARMVNSAVPAKFKDENGKTVEFSILDTLCISVRLMNDIDLTLGDENGNPSEFYGIGKQEFFPYRAGIDGNGKYLKVDINAPNGYCIGIISTITDMEKDLVVKDLTVKGSILGKTKVGVMAYYDMVCNEYVPGSNLKVTNVVNEADVTGYFGVGGILGATAMHNDIPKASFENCENKGNITLVENGRYVGGIVGAAGLFYREASINAKNVTNSGAVTGASGTNYVGGIAGALSGKFNQLTNVINTGDVTSAGSMVGELCGLSGVVYGNVTDGIGYYSVTDVEKIKKISFKEIEMSSVYGKTKKVSLNYTFVNENGKDETVKPSENYTINLAFTNNTTNATVEVEQNTLDDYYDVNTLDPGVYTVKILVKPSDGYYNDPNMPEEIELTSQAVFTVSKATLEFAFENKSCAYTGQAINYFDVSGFNSKLPEGGSWTVEYYKNGNKVNEVKSAGEYDVKITLSGSEAFKNRYNFNAETVTVKLSVLRTLIVTVNDVSVEKGKQATFTVTAVSADGEAYTNYSALGLVFAVDPFGTDNTTTLPVKEYVVKVSGNTSVDGYSTIEYKTGKLTVTNVAENSASSNEEEEKGCGLNMGVNAVIGVVIASIGAILLKKKED